MGGAPCIINFRAIMGRFTAIPADKSELPEFDRRLRRVFEVYEFDQSVHNETPYTKGVCDALEKEPLDSKGREQLWDAALKVCGEPYS